MLAEDRRTAIMELLDEASSVAVNDLAATFGTSAVTIRSDLDALAAVGRLRRTHGGAVSLSRTRTVSEQDRRVNVNVRAKVAIAREAARLVKPGDSVLVDSGTTALELVRKLATIPELTIVTDDLTIADFIDRSAPGLQAILLGGVLRKGHRYTSGPIALRALEALHPTVAFVTPTSYVPGRGFMTNNQNMAELKRTMLTCASATYALMDKTKIGAPGLMWFGTLSAVDAVVMDDDPDGLVAQDAQEATTRLILAKA